MTDKIAVIEELKEDLKLHGRVAYAIVNDPDEYSLIRLDPTAEYHFIDADEHVAFD